PGGPPGGGAPQVGPQGGAAGGGPRGPRPAAPLRLLDEAVLRERAQVERAVGDRLAGALGALGGGRLAQPVEDVEDLEADRVRERADPLRAAALGGPGRGRRVVAHVSAAAGAGSPRRGPRTDGARPARPRGPRRRWGRRSSGR